MHGLIQWHFEKEFDCGEEDLECGVDELGRDNGPGIGDNMVMVFGGSLDFE